MRLSKRQPTTAPTDCGLSFDRDRNEVVMVEQAADGSYDITRVPADETRAVNLTALVIHTVTSGWGVHTDRTPVVTVTPEADDKAVLEAHIQAANASNGSAGIRYAFTRTRDNSAILLTQTRSSDVEETCEATADWAARQAAGLKGYDVKPAIRVETVSRAIARLWLSGPVIRPDYAEAATTLFLTAGKDGFAVGIWSPDSGFVYETEESHHKGADAKLLAGHILSKIIKMASASSLNELSLKPIKQIVITSVESLLQPLMDRLNESTDLKEIRVAFLRPASSDQEDAGIDQPTALAMGALIESDLIPRFDLSLDLESQLAAIRNEETTLLMAREQVGRTAATVALVMPVLLIAVFLLASWYMRHATISSLEQSKESKKAALVQLNQENKDYESAKVNFGVIAGLITQITTLRDRQTAPYQFLVDLDQRVPSEDSSWYFSEVNTTGANVEIKGKTKNQQAITVFIRNLENSEGLFTNIFLVNNVPGVTQSPAAAAQSSNGVTDFTIKAVYTPLNNPPPKQATATPQPQAAPPTAANGAPGAGAPNVTGQPPQQAQASAGGTR